METEFKVKTGEFEGPLEVLLDLVEKRKMHINDVSLSYVADAFIEHVKSYENFPMADSADFILIASTLLLIKSKSLLPNLELTEDEQSNIEDLEKRLDLYKIFKNASLELSSIFGKSELYFANESRNRPVVFSPTSEINIENILSAMQDVLSNAPRPEILPKIKVQKVMSLEEMINNLSDRIQKSIKMSFKDFSSVNKGDKVLVIVSFLAMLELVKQGALRVSQETHFSDISMESESLTVPKY